MIRQPLSFFDELTVEVFVDGEKVRTYFYEGDSEPIITNHSSGTRDRGDESA